MKNKRDIDILEKIIRYCGETEEATQQFGNSIDVLKQNSVYKNAVAMCVLQIGELVGHLSEGFKAEHNEMPWRDIKAMRNIAAHKYGSFDMDMLWDTITGDIPALKDYCEGICKKDVS